VMDPASAVFSLSFFLFSVFGFNKIASLVLRGPSAQYTIIYIVSISNLSTLSYI
jgi:hypothetical protein